MVRWLIATSLVAGLVVCLLRPAGAQPAGAEPPARGEEPLVEQVRRAIDHGVQYLREKQTADGGWEIDQMGLIMSHPGGASSLALLALMNSGVPANDDTIRRGLAYLRKLEPKDTYVTSLQTMAFSTAGQSTDLQRIQRNVDWLVEAFHKSGGTGWGYRNAPLAEDGSDNSNTQYAVLGLHAGRQAGARISQDIWRKIRSFYALTQQGNGGWNYKPMMGDRNTVRLTMTTAGLCGLLISAEELNPNREQLLPDGTANFCGRYTEDPNIQKALDWIGGHFNVECDIGGLSVVYYNLYGIERAGRLSGRRFLGNHDWYREGCTYLVRHQNKEEGYWAGGPPVEHWRVVSTSFALLFLSKGRVPVLISKLAHGPRNDWNNDRNDARYLVEYASRELFKKQPLAWQVFEPERALGQGTREETIAVAADLLQSPIAYMSGHQAPTFTAGEEAVLKEYLEQGGFLLAEACCGRKEFDQGFRDLMKHLFPDQEDELKLLPPEHPIWHAHFPIPPGSYPLYGIERSCKTIVVYSPKDLSCRWETNHPEATETQLAFRVGANIVAYATGLEAPRPRLTEADVVVDRPETAIPRGYLKVVQLRHDGDWQPAPKAMKNLLIYLKDRPRLDVSVQPETLDPSNPELFNYKFLYLHGRNAFTFSEPALANLRADLQAGAVMLSDACCGKRAFDQAFREMAVKLFPDHKLEPIPPTDELFGERLNGQAIRTVRCRRPLADGSPEPQMQDHPPALEGIRINGRWAVIYSKYDLGCALEKHKSTDCLGHDYDSALKLAAAAVFYALKR